MSVLPSEGSLVPQASLASDFLGPDFLATLHAICGQNDVLTTPEALAPFLVETRGLLKGHVGAVVRPRTAQAISAIVIAAQAAGVPFVVQGGNTGLLGGGVPFGGIVISLAHLNRIRDVDEINATLTLEAGVVLQHAQDAATQAGMLFPLSLASEGSCTIGGNIATNAGGTAVLRYGNMRDLVLGLEVVLPDGQIFNGLSGVRKDNSGYDLKHLFIGSEGTLGIVTAAVLKLFPRPISRSTAFVGASSPEAIVALFHALRNTAGERLTTFEIMPRFGVEIVLRHAPNTRDPLSEAHLWYALIELTSPDAAASLEDVLMSALEAALEAEHIQDAALANSEAQSHDFWRIREQLSECQRFEGGSIKHDICVPISQIAAFMDDAIGACAAVMPGLRPCVFGHIGDGNLHFNLSQPVGMEKAVFLREWKRFNTLVHDRVVMRGGSIAAEHGVGVFKREELAHYKDPVALSLMKTIKRALDPHNLLNPGKVIAMSEDLPMFQPGDEPRGS